MRHDPIAKKFITPEIIERILKWAFPIGCLLSFAPMLDLPKQLADIAAILFIITTLLIFALGYLVRLAFLPEGEESRVSDFIGKAYQVNLSPTPTIGYYTGEETTPERRMASQLLENLLFTKTISAIQLKPLRWITSGYIILWLTALICRDVQLEWIIIATQVIFSEEICARYIKLEWLNSKTEKLYNEVHRLIANPPPKNQFTANIIEKICTYEKVKSTASIILCSKTFTKINPSLSADWVAIQQRLGLKQ